MVKSEKKYDKIFIFGDIHGCSLELKIFLKKLPITEDSLVIFIGDYVDRGEDSRGVVDEILKLQKRCHVIPLMGNHEKMLLDYVDNKDTAEAGSFIFNGGASTIASYGDEFGQYQIPESHMNFYRNLLPFFEMENYFFVHAGVPDVDLKSIDVNYHEEDLLWIRKPFIQSQYKWDKMIVHGHTPMKKYEITKSRINLDTGLVFGGRLTVLQLPDKKFYSLPRQKSQLQKNIKESKGEANRSAKRFKGNMPIHVYVGEKVFQFETVDYSEFHTHNFSRFGILMFDPINHNKQVLTAGQKISGIIGDDRLESAEFTGEVIRCDKKNVGIFYAITFSTTFQDLPENTFDDQEQAEEDEIEQD
jgi:serine/threonine protein phosphatase 1